MADIDEKTRDEAFETIEPIKTHEHPSLGHVRLRHADTNEIILTPAPSRDVNDPLRW